MKKITIAVVVSVICLQGFFSALCFGMEQGNNTEEESTFQVTHLNKDNLDKIATVNEGAQKVVLKDTEADDFTFLNNFKKLVSLTIEADKISKLPDFTKFPNLKILVLKSKKERTIDPKILKEIDALDDLQKLEIIGLPERLNTTDQILWGTLQEKYKNQDEGDNDLVIGKEEKQIHQESYKKALPFKELHEDRESRRKQSSSSVAFNPTQKLAQKSYDNRMLNECYKERDTRQKKNLSQELLGSDQDREIIANKQSNDTQISDSTETSSAALTKKSYNRQYSAEKSAIGKKFYERENNHENPLPDQQKAQEVDDAEQPQQKQSFLTSLRQNPWATLKKYWLPTAVGLGAVGLGALYFYNKSHGKAMRSVAIE